MKGWELVDVYVDAGRSGKAMKGRDGLLQLLEDANHHEFERVLFWRLDRLGRSMRDLLQIYDQLEGAGASLVSIQEGIDTSTLTGQLVRNILAAISEFERGSIVERIKAGLAEKQRQGELTGTLPFGYLKNYEGAVVVDSYVAPLIKEAFLRYATGQYSLQRLANWATSVGLRTRDGNHHSKSSVRDLLTTVSYTGQVARYRRKGGQIVAKGKHPAIIDMDTFSQVQDVLSRRRFSPPSRPFGRQPYPLSGVAICSSCLSPFVGLTAGKVDKRYLRCATTHRRGRYACSQPMVAAELLEGQIASYVGGIRLPVEYIGEVVAELRRRQRRVEDPSEAPTLRRELERWQKLYAVGEIEEASYKREATAIRKRLAEVDQPREVLDVERAVYYLRDVGNLWADSPKDMQRAFVREVFDRIMVEGAQITSITPKTDYAPLFMLDRQERFGGVCSMVGATGVSPTQLNPTSIKKSSKEMFLVPALILPVGHEGLSYLQDRPRPREFL